MRKRLVAVAASTFKISRRDLLFDLIQDEGIQRRGLVLDTKIPGTTILIFRTEIGRNIFIENYMNQNRVQIACSMTFGRREEGFFLAFKNEDLLLDPLLLANRHDLPRQFLRKDHCL